MELVIFVESGVLGMLSLLTLILYLMAFRRILNENNNIFDKIDKSIIITAGIQIILLTLVFLILNSDIFCVIIRLSRLFQEAILWMILSFLIFDESKYEVIYKIMMGISFLIGIFGLISIFQLLFMENPSIQLSFIIYSALTLLINLMSVCFGLKVLFIIHDYFQKEINESSPDDSDLEGGKNHLKYLTYEEMKNRKMQIYILVSVHFVSSCLQFFWDIIAYTYSEESDYYQYYNPSDFLTLCSFIVLKIIVWFFPVWVIYFVFYWRNRTYFGDSDAQNNYVLVEFKRESEILF